eukprot:CAMPEP_0185729106 /NCGR_PEP_ID=MMETSP1171-20130828/4474_1 /TAXON_ID=374046 /ORGANISM="Helicotheca tamensis, Strain CCMP826" /LENGTH=170 /DNA_ID=CAMNT_0028397883 /DNA_START=94 /DNA_END=606 /DNA_ORIENTATION=-
MSRCAKQNVAPMPMPTGIQRIKQASALSLYSKGVKFAKQRRWDDAINMYHSALALQRKIFGLDHPITARTLNELGVVLVLKGDDAAAVKAFEEALYIRELNLGSGHKDTAETLTNLFMVIRRIGEHKFTEIKSASGSVTIRSKRTAKSSFQMSFANVVNLVSMQKMDTSK